MDVFLVETVKILLMYIIAPTVTAFLVGLVLWAAMSGKD